jgi:hypothetical protein
MGETANEVVPAAMAASEGAAAASGTGQATTVKDPVYKQTLADPVYSGFGTWIGTLISIGAAVAAWRQARAAKSFTARLTGEQKRTAVNATLLKLNTIENHLSALWDTTPRRGLKVSKIIADAKQECHHALGGLSKERDAEIRLLLQRLEERLDWYLKEPKDRPVDLDTNTRRDLQDLTSMCNDAIERFAVEK